eukprot:6191523-Pleurochrysis_carterae.AAC.3
MWLPKRSCTHSLSWLDINPSSPEIQKQSATAVRRLHGKNDFGSPQRLVAPRCLKCPRLGRTSTGATKSTLHPRLNSNLDNALLQLAVEFFLLSLSLPAPRNNTRHRLLLQLKRTPGQGTGARGFR